MDRALSTPVDVEELCARWNTGASLEEIAAWLDRSTAATSKLVERLRRDGAELINRRAQLVDSAVARRQRLLELAQAGHSRPALAEALGCSADAIAADLKWLRDHGHDVEIATAARTRRLRVLDDVRVGRSRREMADRHGVPVETIRSDLKWLRRNGLLGSTEYAGGVQLQHEPLSRSDGELIRELWNDRVATDVIAERVGRDPAVVRRYVGARRRHRGDVDHRYRIGTG